MHPADCQARAVGNLGAVGPAGGRGPGPAQDLVPVMLIVSEQTENWISTGQYLCLFLSSLLSEVQPLFSI